MGEQAGLLGHRVPDRGELRPGSVLRLILLSGPANSVFVHGTWNDAHGGLALLENLPRLLSRMKQREGRARVGWLLTHDRQISLLGLGCLVVSWFEHFRTPQWRPYRALMFVGLGLSGIVPVLHALTLYSYSELDERMGLSWVLLQGLLYVTGAFIYAVCVKISRNPAVGAIRG